MKKSPLNQKLMRRIAHTSPWPRVFFLLSRLFFFLFIFFLVSLSSFLLFYTFFSLKTGPFLPLLSLLPHAYPQLISTLPLFSLFFFFALLFFSLALLRRQGRNYKKSFLSSLFTLVPIVFTLASLLALPLFSAKLRYQYHFSQHLYAFLEKKGLKTEKVLVGRVFLQSPHGLVLAQENKKILVLDSRLKTTVDLRGRLVKIRGKLIKPSLFEAKNIQILKKP